MTETPSLSGPEFDRAVLAELEAIQAEAQWVARYLPGSRRWNDEVARLVRARAAELRRRLDR